MKDLPDTNAFIEALQGRVGIASGRFEENQENGLWITRG
jgi:hypothetical protein